MAPTAVTVRNMLDTLEEEDYKMAISYIEFLSDARRKERQKKAIDVMEGIQNLVGDDKGWNSEEEMIVDMANFRRERLGR